MARKTAQIETAIKTRGTLFLMLAGRRSFRNRSMLSVAAQQIQHMRRQFQDSIQRFDRAARRSRQIHNQDPAPRSGGRARERSQWRRSPAFGAHYFAEPGNLAV